VRPRPQFTVAVPVQAAMALWSLAGKPEGARARDSYRELFSRLGDTRGVQVVEEVWVSLEALAKTYTDHGPAFVGASVSAVSAQVGASSVLQELTTGQVADRLGVTPARVRQLIEDGRLIARKEGRSWLIETVSLEAHMRGKS